MNFIISLVGCVNSGKSSLFNCLVKKNKSLVGDFFGLTRDYKCESIFFKKNSYYIIDTGGIYNKKELFFDEIDKKTFSIIRISDVILFILDKKFIFDANNFFIEKLLKNLKKNVILVVNKIDNYKINNYKNYINYFNFNNIVFVSALRKKNINVLLKKIFSVLKNIFFKKKDVYKKQNNFIKKNYVNFLEKKNNFDTLNKVTLSVIGRPNVGKSTLINKIIGKNRLLVDSQSGTTTDNIYLSILQKNIQYVFIDTAGIRKKRSIKSFIEKSFVQKSFESIKLSNIVLFVIDANFWIFSQDFSILSWIMKYGCPVIIVINKWDCLNFCDRILFKKSIKKRLVFFSFIKICFVSSINGFGINKLFLSIIDTYSFFFKKINTSFLTKILHKAINFCKVPIISGCSVKFKYARFGGYFPFTIIIYCGKNKNVPKNYICYLKKFFYKSLNIYGILIKIIIV